MQSDVLVCTFEKNGALVVLIMNKEEGKSRHHQTSEAENTQTQS